MFGHVSVPDWYIQLINRTVLCVLLRKETCNEIYFEYILYIIYDRRN